MTTTGTGIFYDGLTSDRHKVAVDIAGDAIEVKAPDGTLLARWRIKEAYPLATSNEVLRIGVASANIAARLEIHDAELAAALLPRLKRTDRGGLTDGRTRLKMAAWSAAAIASLVGGAIWGVPLLADQIAPHLPVAWEIQLGEAIDAQVRQMFDPSKGSRPFECGAGDTAHATAARNAFRKLIGSLEEAAELPLPVHALVVRSPRVNAITLPGGRVYVFSGLLAKAQSADEVAGVIGHEFGHVAHRDGTKAVLEAAGLSLLFGMVLGDFGGGTAADAAKTLLETSYSRTAEAAADEFGGRRIYKAGGDPRALGTILLRISGQAGAAVPHFLLDHPEAQARADALVRIGQPSPMKTVLTSAEWNALKGICAER